MNNIELRLYAERSWREENYLRTKNTKEQNTMKHFVTNVMHHFPGFMAFELLNTNLSGLCDKKISLPLCESCKPNPENSTRTIKFLSKKKSVATTRS